jgi:trypsin-like peptidase
VNDFEFRSDAGEPFSGAEVVFPLFTEGDNRRLILRGSGFYFLKSGFFLTAEHCLFEPDGSKLPFAVGLLPHGHLRRVSWVVRHESYDFALGRFEPGEHNCQECESHRVLTLTRKSPVAGEEVQHFGCTGSVLDEFDVEGDTVVMDGRLILKGYGGVYERFCAGEGFTPWPHHFMKSFFPSGASGGPTFGAEGRVCGINSTSSEVLNGPSYSRVVRAEDVLDARFTGRIVAGNVALENPTFGEIVDAASI